MPGAELVDVRAVPAHRLSVRRAGGEHEAHTSWPGSDGISTKLLPRQGRGRCLRPTPWAQECKPWA